MEFRMGDPLLLGWDMYRDQALLGGDFRQDIFRLTATVLEVAERDIRPPTPERPQRAGPARRLPCPGKTPPGAGGLRQPAHGRPGPHAPRDGLADHRFQRQLRRPGRERLSSGARDGDHVRFIPSYWAVARTCRMPHIRKTIVHDILPERSLPGTRPVAPPSGNDVPFGGFMNTIRRAVAPLLVCLLLLPLLPGTAPLPLLTRTGLPGTRHGGRIYVEGGPFSDYQRIFQGLALGLEERGPIRNGHVPLPKDSEEVRVMWEWLHRHAGGNRLVFLADGFYSASGTAGSGKKVRQDVLRRIREKKDVDMVLAFGTWAGQDLAAQDLPVPVIVSSVTNAVDAGIIPRWKIRVGTIWWLPSSRTVSSARSCCSMTSSPSKARYRLRGYPRQAAAASLSTRSRMPPGNWASPCCAVPTPSTSRIRTFASERLLACHKKLVEQGAEAVYLTYNVGLQASAMRNVLQPLADAHIPTFSQLGVPDVVHGALLSVAQSNAAEEGRFSAGLVEAIAQGRAPA